MNTRAPFWRHNRELIADLRDMEAKSRRRDMLVDEEVIYGFYANRVPDDVYSVAQLESWLRKLPPERAKVLHMRMQDLQPADLDAGMDGAVSGSPRSATARGCRCVITSRPARTTMA